VSGMRMRQQLALGTLALALVHGGITGCGSPGPRSQARWSLAPSREGIYERTCKTCHEKQGSGAPLARDPAAWRERVKNGRATLLEHTINGFGGMPPLGSCMECSEADLRIFVAFLAGLERPNPEPAR